MQKKLQSTYDSSSLLYISCPLVHYQQTDEPRPRVEAYFTFSAVGMSGISNFRVASLIKTLEIIL